MSPLTPLDLEHVGGADGPPPDVLPMPTVPDPFPPEKQL
jgi:hypothetical protein